MVGYRFSSFVMILYFPLLLSAQNYSDFKTVDSITYRQYDQQDWKPLIETGKLALKNGLDYYYLRMRKGIAEFETGKYFTAVSDFDKALTFNKDLTTKSYKYFSLLKSGKNNRAKKFSNQFSIQEKDKLGIHIKTINEFDFYGGYALSNNIKKNGNINLLNSDSTNYGQQLLIGDNSYLHAGITGNIGKSLSVYASFSFLNIQKQERFQYKTANFYLQSTNHLGNGSYINVFGLENKQVEQIFEDAIKQEEIYLNAKLQLENGWSASIFGNLLFVHLKQYRITPNISIQNDTLRYIQPTNTYMLIPHRNVNYQISPNDTSFMDWVTGFNVEKDFNLIVLNLGATLSRIYNDKQYQSTLSATYYPFGSFALYGTTGITYFYEPDAIQVKDVSRFLVDQTIGVQLAKKAWLEGEYIYGDLRNMNIKQGLVVYNLSDKINYTIGAKLYIFAGNHLMINLQGNFYDKSGVYFNFSGPDNSINTYNLNYQVFSIIGGIKWII